MTASRRVRGDDQSSNLKCLDQITLQVESNFMSISGSTEYNILNICAVFAAGCLVGFLKNKVIQFHEGGNTNYGVSTLFFCIVPLFLKEIDWVSKVTWIVGFLIGDIASYPFQRVQQTYDIHRRMHRRIENRINQGDLALD